MKARGHFALARWQQQNQQMSRTVLVGRRRWQARALRGVHQKKGKSGESKAPESPPPGSVVPI